MGIYSSINLCINFSMDFFTKETYIEVIDILNDEQLQRECLRHRKNAKQGPLKSTEAMRAYLISRANNLKEVDHINENIQFTISEACDDLVSVISNSLHANTTLIESYREELDAFHQKQADPQPEQAVEGYESLSTSIDNFKHELTSHIMGKSDTHRDESVMEKIREIEDQISKVNVNIASIMDEGIEINYINASQQSTDIPINSATTEDVSISNQESVLDTTRKPKAKRVLILSDSRNLDFDINLFKQPIECKIYPMYHLKNILQVEPLILESDIVLISSGVNDITQWKWDGASVANFLIDFLTTAQQKFPNTQFLINSIAPTKLVAKVNDAYLRNIHDINSMLFKFCITASNATLFDNEELKWDHISNDGIHFTLEGKTSLSKCWVEVVLRCFGFRRGPVPLRPSFKIIANRYY